MSAMKLDIVLPYYNEARFIEATLNSLARQRDRRFRLILVDNNSADGSSQIARRVCEAAMPDIECECLSEGQPGKIHALETGMAAAKHAFVATIDADTIYPEHYVRRTIEAFENDAAIVCVLAFDRPDQVKPTPSAKQRLFAAMFTGKCHTGGFGQAFRRDALLSAGGFDANRWPYVLEDHEIVHRIGKFGRLAYPKGHACFPSDRRTDRSDCSWTLFERVLYKVMPKPFMDWFLYSFLATRFERRGLRNVKLRDQAWQGAD